MTDRRYDLHDKIAQRDAVIKEFSIFESTNRHALQGTIQRMAEEILKLRDAVNGAGNLGLKWADELFEWKAYSAKLRRELEIIEAQCRRDKYSWGECTASAALALPRPGGEE